MQGEYYREAGLSLDDTGGELIFPDVLPLKPPGVDEPKTRIAGKDKSFLYLLIQTRRVQQFDIFLGLEVFFEPG